MAISMSAWLTACGGSDDPAVPPPAPPPSEGSATIGAAGGFVDGPDGVRLGIPPGAVDSGVTFRIARDGSGAPPLPGGIDLLSAVYAITPHGQVFNQPVAVRVPSNVAQAAGRPTFLMKAEPGGRWAVIGTDSGAVDALTASIDSLSYVAVGACTNNLPPNSLFAQNCPTSNVLRFELLTDSGDPFPVSQDTTYSAIQPVLLVTTPTVLTGRITWTRAPFAAARVDTLETGSRFTGTATGVIVQRQLGIAWSAEAPNVREVTQNFTSTFTITVTPAQVFDARNVNGVVRPLWAQARAGEWEYNAVIPIRIRDVSAPPPAPAPTITQQPANAGVVEGQPASFSVAASITPAAALTYQWSRRADTSAAFAPIAGATCSHVQPRHHGAYRQRRAVPGGGLCGPDPLRDLQPGHADRHAGTDRAELHPAAGEHRRRGRPDREFYRDGHWQPVAAHRLAVGNGQRPEQLHITLGCAQLRAHRSASQRHEHRRDLHGWATCHRRQRAALSRDCNQRCHHQQHGGHADGERCAGGAGHHAAARGADDDGRWQCHLQRHGHRHRAAGLRVAAGRDAAALGERGVQYRQLHRRRHLQQWRRDDHVDLTGGCNGVPVNVTVSNGVGSVTSNPAALTVSGTSSPWATQTVNFRNALTSVFAVNSRTAWATSASGEVLRTIDGGATWSVQVSGGNNLSDISAVDANTAWAVGGESIVKTIDGGATWSLQNGAAGEYLYSVSAVNAQVASAVGFAGVILKTTDGGASWITQVAATNAQKNLTSVVAVDQNTAWAVGTFQILKTTDGGISWISQTSAVPAAVQGFLQVVAATDRVAWIVTDRRDTRAAVLRTADGGVTWNDVTRPGTAESTHRLAAVRGNPNLLWALTSTGFDNSRAHISSNGGNSWSNEVLPGRGILYDVSAVDETTGWIVGDGGRILKR